MGKTKKSRRTKKKYSKRKYLNKAKTNRRYSKNKYTRHKHTRHKHTRRKKITKKKLRGGMGGDADAELFASSVGTEDLTESQREEFAERDTKARQLMREHEESFMHKYTDWYIKGSAGTPEKQGRRTTDELEELPNGTVIKYVENLTGDHQWYLTNALVMGQQMMGAEAATEKYGYYENGKIYNAVQNEEGKWVKDSKDTTGQSFGFDFKNRYHIKVVNEGFNIKTDFQSGQYVITFEDNPHNPLALDFDTFSGERLTIDKYVTSGTMDLYRISMNFGEKTFHSDIRWSSFERLVAECVKEIKSNPSFESYSELGDCQKEIEEIHSKLEAKRSEWGQSANAVVKSLRRGMAALGETAQGMSTSLSGLAAGMWSGTAPAPSQAEEPERQATEVEPEPQATEVEPEPQAAEVEPEPQAAEVEYVLDGNSINAENLTLPENPSSENFATRKFMIVSIARLIKCGFLSIVYKHLDSSQRDSGAMEPEPVHGDKSLVVAGEGSKQLGFIGGALQLAKTPTKLAMTTFEKGYEKGKGAVTYAGAAAGQVAQNIFEGMASEEWVQLKKEVSKELLYERMCSFGKGFDQQVADSIANIANATSTFSKTTGYGQEKVIKAKAKFDEINAELKDLEKRAYTKGEMNAIKKRLKKAKSELDEAERTSLSSVAGMVGKAADNYENAKQAVNIAKTAADWWTSLNPSTAVAKAGGALAWRSANLAYYVQKVKNNNNKAQKPAQDLWKNLCLLLAECELDEDDASNDIIKSQRVLNIFADYARDEDDPKKLHMDAVLASRAAYGHPGAAVIKKFLEQQRQGGPQPEPQQLLEDGGA